MATSSPQGRSPAQPSRRRRQRSVRVTVAVALLSAATAAVLLALPTQSPVWLSVSSVLALCFGWAAARILYSEVAQSRRDHAADRLAQAEAYRSIFTTRADEHAEFTTAMTDRLATRDREISELQSSLVAAQQRAGQAEARVNRESRRANDAAAQVEELTQRVSELEVSRQQAAERADQLAAWEGFETVVDLMAWEQKLGEAVTAAQQAAQDQKHA